MTTRQPVDFRAKTEKTSMRKIKRPLSEPLKTYNNFNRKASSKMSPKTQKFDDKGYDSNIKLRTIICFNCDRPLKISFSF